MPKSLLSSLLFLLFAAALSLAIGSVFISPADLWILLRGAGDEKFAFIVWNIRMPRTVLVALTGAALSGCGAAYQGLFRNPLADPFLIGVASGAGLGAVIAMSIQWPYSFWGLMAIPIAAFIAALLTVFIVYQLARVGRTIPTTNLILAGVAFSSFATSLSSFLMLRSTSEVRRALGWLLGGASQAGWTAILAMLPYLVIGLGILIAYGYRLNLLQFGDDQARQTGLERGAHEDGFADRVLAGDGGGGGILRHHRFYWAYRPAHHAPVVRRGLPPTHPAVHYWRRVGIASLGYPRAHRACAAGNPGRHHHRPGGRAVLPVDSA
ncbi:MAG: iron ABC transporter permease [Chloroflexi bacterium]|nr:iron ABC transporter permease [Chloroflexota bacterium]